MLQANTFERWLCGEALDSLVAEASETLMELSGGQYQLDRDERNELIVIDYQDAGSRRPVHTLSGGETFQASLALALALSRQVIGLSAGMRDLNSMFLDEGFGTLDEDTLETVATTLERLATDSDRMVGVITHVPALAERVPVRFVVSHTGTHPRCARNGYDQPARAAGRSRGPVGSRVRHGIRRRTRRWALDASKAELDLDVELPADQWRPVTPDPAVRSPAPCCSWTGCAGSRPGSGSRATKPQPFTGIAASYAAGLVRCDGAARMAGVNVERGLFTAYQTPRHHHPAREVPGPWSGRAAGLISYPWPCSGPHRHRGAARDHVPGPAPGRRRPADRGRAVARPHPPASEPSATSRPTTPPTCRARRRRWWPR